MLRAVLKLVLAMIGLGLLVGCRSHSCADLIDETMTRTDLAIAGGLQAPAAESAVKAMAVPPVGWKAEPLKASDRHTHQVWLSPTGDTAYGIIYFTLPFPVGPDLTLWGFLQEMQKKDGKADLLSKQSDDRLPGLRFVAQGTMYTLRTNLIVKGFHAWAVYAGSLNQRPVNEGELLFALRACEQTRVGLP